LGHSLKLVLVRFVADSPNLVPIRRPRGSLAGGAYLMVPHCMSAFAVSISSLLYSRYRWSLSLKLSDTRVYEPQIRARPGLPDGAALHQCLRSHRRSSCTSDRMVLSANYKTMWGAMTYRTYRQIIGCELIKPVMITPLRGGSGYTLGPYCSHVPRALWLS